MASAFHFEHRFRAASPAVVLAAVMDPVQRAAQDRAVDVARRELVSDDDAPDTRALRFVVYPRRQLPAVVRAVVRGDLAYDETIVWTKAADRVDYDIRPRLLDGRARIIATYQLTAGDPGEVVRRYHGTVTVDLRLIGGRIERMIVDDLGRSLAVAAQVTQDHLDRGAAS